MLRTVSTSGRHVGLLVHVPVAASVVRDHGLLTVASAVHGGGQTPYGPATPGDPVDSHPLGPRQIRKPVGGRPRFRTMIQRPIAKELA
jgi:hypothetical protein